MDGLDDVEHVFEYRTVSAAAVLDEVPDLPVRGVPAAQTSHRTPGPSTLDELRQRVHRMQGGTSGRRLPGLTPDLDLATGAAYATDSAGLALALLAGPSAAGEWVGVVGAPDLGYEAAAGLGVDLERTIVVPHPGEHWLSVVAALVDVASVVLVRPSVVVGEHPAERLRARLRTKDAALVCWGEWPRCSARFRVRESVWSGLGRGHGHLTGRRLVVEVDRTGSPRQTFGLDLPGRGGVEPVRTTSEPVRTFSGSARTALVVGA